VFGVLLAVLTTAIQDRNWAETIDLAARIGGGHVTLQHPEYLDSPKLTYTIRGVEQLIDTARTERQVIKAVPRIVGQTMLRSADESRGAGFIAYDPKLEDQTTLSVLDALPAEQDFETSHDQGIILGVRLAQILNVKMGHRVVYTLTDINGDIVSGLARLSGIVTTGVLTLDSSLCLLPINSVRQTLHYQSNEATQVAIFIQDQRESEQIAEQLQKKFDSNIAALPWFITQPELAGFIAMKVGGARFMEILIAILVAAGIYNTLFVSVMERIREFGILLAIGFSPLKLFSLVMLESFWLAVVGLIAALVVTAGPYYYLTVTGIDISSWIQGGNTEIAGVAFPTTIKV
jgi:ABC-type lipoprotein release transport system permease subunit